MDEKVYDWILEQRIKQHRVSYKSIRVKAREIHSAVQTENYPDFKASSGWLQKFMKRHKLSLRRKTSLAQKDPNSLFEKIVDFLLYSGNLISKNKISPANIIAMDETGIFFDMPSATTVDQVGKRTISLKTTGKLTHMGTSDPVTLRFSRNSRSRIHLCSDETRQSLFMQWFDFNFL
jgi:hypothetical protein